MIGGGLGSTCRGGVGPLIAIPPGHVYCAKAMDSSSSSMGGSPNPHHAQQKQRNYRKAGVSANLAGVGRGQGYIENRGSTRTSASVVRSTIEKNHVSKSAPISTAVTPRKEPFSGPESEFQKSSQPTPQESFASIPVGVVKPTNVGNEISKSAQGSVEAKPRKGSFGGPGSSVQKSSQFTPQVPSCEIQFGTVGVGDSSPSASNGLSEDFPQLPNNVGPARVSTQQTVTPCWNKKQMGRVLESAQVLESKPSPPVKGTSVIDPNTESVVMSPKRPAERHLGGSERLSSGGGDRSSKDSVPASPPPPSMDGHFPPLGASSATAGNTKFSRKVVGRGQAEQAQAQAPLPSEHQEPPNQSDFPPLVATSTAAGNRKLSTKGGGRVPAEQAQAPLPSEPQEPPKSTDFPPLGASSAAAGNWNKLTKGGGRVSAGQAQGPLSGEHEEPQRRDEADSPASVQAGRGRERQSRKDVYYDKRKAGDRQGAEWGNGLETGGQRHGWRNYQGSDAVSEKEKSIEALGRTLTRILRHQAIELKLKMSIDGYVYAQDLLKLPMKTGANRPLLSHTIDDVKQAVEQDKKQRFGIKEENGQLFIRANQGHTIKSLKSEDLLTPIVSGDEIPVCVHGTYFAYLDQISEEGLKTMDRNHVHFASGVVGSEGVISGMRTTCEVLIYLNVEKALADGMKLYISENKVILTEGFEGVVPPEYFKEVLRFSDMKAIPPRSAAA